MKVRNYTPKDYDMIVSWWKAANEMPPNEAMLPLDTTFVIEMDNQPAACITIYLTNSKQFSLLDNLVGNPELRGEKRKEAVKKLVEHSEKFSKDLGYKRLMCLAYKGPLVKRYNELGYHPTVDSVVPLLKEL